MGRLDSFVKRCSSFISGAPHSSMFPDCARHSRFASPRLRRTHARVFIHTTTPSVWERGVSTFIVLQSSVAPLAVSTQAKKARTSVATTDKRQAPTESCFASRTNQLDILIHSVKLAISLPMYILEQSGYCSLVRLDKTHAWASWCLGINIFANMLRIQNSCKYVAASSA